VDVRYVPGLAALVFALSASAANCQSSGPSAKPAPGVQPHLVCNAGYSAELCRRQTEVLRGVLARYPTGALGEWRWVLVRSEDWKPMKRRLLRDPDSPAFTVLRDRRTFIEEGARRARAATEGRTHRALVPQHRRPADARDYS
jgi:hypothetical protein